MNDPMNDPTQMDTQPWQQTASRPGDQILTQPSPAPGPEGVELGTGYLAVNVTTRLGLYPLAGAVVTVSSGEGTDQRVWARAQTNANGQVPPIPLPAPPGLWSQYPQTPQKYAYGRYDLLVEAEEMSPSLRRNIQIFDGVTSIQNVDMLWDTVAAETGQIQIIDEGEDYDL